MYKVLLLSSNSQKIENLIGNTETIHGTYLASVHACRRLKDLSGQFMQNDHSREYNGRTFRVVWLA